MGSTAKKQKPVKPEISKQLLARVSKDDPLHIARARKNALSDYQKTLVPTRVGHVWKHTNPSQFIPDLDAPPSEKRFLTSRQSGDTTVVQFLVGSDLFVTLNDEATQKGVEVLSLEDAPASIGKVVPSSSGFFESMNQSLWSSGIYLRVPAQVVLNTPIQLNIVTDGRHPFVRIFVNIEQGASAMLVERISSSSNCGPTVMVSEFEIGPYATLHHGFISLQNDKDSLHYTHGCHLQENASLHLMATSVGEGQLKADFGGQLDGRRAHSDIRTFAVLQHNTQVDFHTRQHHLKENTTSDMKSRSVLLDRAVSSNTGLIRIEENARDCEAFQIARNLILSKDAQATAIPELEIENNDVVCSHGAATGTIDAEQLFYLTSRGLSKSQATRLIVEGGLIEILDEQPEEVQQPIMAAHASVWERLEQRQT